MGSQPKILNHVTGFGANFSITELGLLRALLSQEKAAPGSQGGAVGEGRIFP